MEKQLTVSQKLSVFLLIIFLFCIFYFLGEKNKKNLSNKILSDSTINIAIIDEWYLPYKGSSTLKYHFEYKHIEYQSQGTSSTLLDNYFDLRNYIAGKSFPVIFNRKDPLVNHILIVPEDFKLFNIPYPDSLEWVSDILKKN
jgi:hypothetical protein